MNHLLVVAIRYENERPNNLIQRIVGLFDKLNVVDLNNDDFTTELIEPNGVKSFAINLSYKTKDFKTAIFETLTKANRLGQHWTIQGPIKAKRNLFIMNLDKNEKNNFPIGIVGYRIMLTSE